MEERLAPNDLCPFCTRLNPPTATNCECGAEKVEAVDMKAEGLALQVNKGVKKALLISAISIPLFGLIGWWPLAIGAILIIFICGLFLIGSFISNKGQSHFVTVLEGIPGMKGTINHKWRR